MNRRILIQKILDRKGSGTFLEIGVRRGRTFLPIRARKKIGVDPEFLIPWRDRLGWLLRNPCNLRAEYFEMESDRFFREQSARLQQHRIDVALVDGLHLFEQSLRDVLNSLTYLSPGGVVVMHDCNPRAEPDATRAESAAQAVEIIRSHPDSSGAWNGDVWKTVLYLRQQLPELSVFVLDSDHGLGVIRGTLPPGHSENRDTIEEIKSLPYSYLDENRERILGLKPADHVNEFLQTL